MIPPESLTMVSMDSTSIMINSQKYQKLKLIKVQCMILPGIVKVKTFWLSVVLCLPNQFCFLRTMKLSLNLENNIKIRSNGVILVVLFVLEGSAISMEKCRSGTWQSRKKLDRANQTLHLIVTGHQMTEKLSLPS